MDAAIPIREISRLTGVNSVTLRAWERRYGLIKPLRTNKGHRLYRREDVELIKTIQSWLARGLAISKVSELLDSGLPAKELDIENIWQTYLGELLAIMGELNLGKLDAFFNQLFSVYPAALITDQLIAPVLDNLAQEIFGSSVKKAILINRLSEYLLMLTQRQRQQAQGKRIAIIQLNAPVNLLLNVLLHYGLIMNQVKSELMGLVSAAEVVFVAEQLRLDGVIVYNDSCTSLGEFQKDLLQLAQTITLPIIVAGKLVHVLNAELPAHIHLARNAGQQALLNILATIFPEELIGSDESDTNEDLVASEDLAESKNRVESEAVGEKEEVKHASRKM